MTSSRLVPRRVRASHRLVATLAVAIVAACLLTAPAAPVEAAPSCSRGWVALTFDDGPSPRHTPQVLAALRAKRVPASFFVIGRNVEQSPDTLRRAIADGHDVYNHTYEHPNLTGITDAAIRAQLTTSEKALGYRGMAFTHKLMRPPYGAINARVGQAIASVGYRPILWSIDPRDWVSSTPAGVIRERVLAAVEPGSIILLHDGPYGRPAGAETAKALPGIIDGVHARGLCFGRFGAAGHVVSSGPLSAPQPAPPLAATRVRYTDWINVAPPGAATTPATVSWASDRTDMFATDAEGRLIQRWHISGQGWQPAGWHNYGGLPGGLHIVGPPAVSSMEPGSLDVFVRGSDDAVWHRPYRSGRGWYPWRSLGGVVITSPSAVSDQPDAVHVVAVGLNKQVYLKSYRSWTGGWSGWRRLGGIAASTPTVASWAPNRLDFFVKGPNQALYHRGVDNGRWWDWTNLGGTLSGGGAPAAVSWGDGRLDVFVIGRHRSASYHKAYHRGYGWLPSRTGYVFLGGPGGQLLSGTAASSRRSGHFESYVADASGRIWMRSTR